MTTTYAVTADQLMDACLRKLGVNIQGEAADSTQKTEMLLALNMMAKRFFTLGMPFYREFISTVTPVQGQASYTLTGEPCWNLYQAFLVKTSDSTRIPLQVISREEYNAYINPTDQATPTSVAMSPNGTTAYVYMSPDSTTASDYTIKLYGYQQEDNVTAGSSTIVFPMEWYEALLYGLCVRMCPEYGVSMENQSSLNKFAEAALMDAVNYNPQMTPSIYFGVSSYGR